MFGILGANWFPEGIYWNQHRVYDKIRIPFVASNWIPNGGVNVYPKRVKDEVGKNRTSNAKLTLNPQKYF